MADWVHCNVCFRQPGDGKKFLLTSCGHIYCDKCISGMKCTFIFPFSIGPDVTLSSIKF